MKVLLVNTSDIQGGAARAAYRLHRGLQQIDVESKMLVQTKVSDDFSVTTSAQSKVQKLVARLRPILDSGPVGLYKHRTKTLFSPALFPFSSVAHRISTANVDVAHLHWIAGGMLRIEDVAKIKKPIVWTLHDMWAFTGGCHLDGECGRYKKFCGKCPILSSTRNVDLSRWILKRKQKAWSNINITIVTPSRWLAKCASSSSLFRDRRIEVIANGLDISRYQLMDKSVARRLLSLPQDKRLILFGAMSSTGDRNKGFQFLHPALRELAKDNWGGRVEVIVFGASEPTSPPDFGLKTSYLGRFHDDISLALLYAAADVFLAPSVQDN
ncbi:MAG: glycosyltransferase, partial [Eubacteriales bacterium]|nr:glycosyltransferase [Eubacteriales bacterium]